MHYVQTIVFIKCLFEISLLEISRIDCVLIKLKTEDCFYHEGPLVAQWVKRWPTDLAVRSSRPAEARRWSDGAMVLGAGCPTIWIKKKGKCLLRLQKVRFGVVWTF